MVFKVGVWTPQCGLSGCVGQKSAPDPQSRRPARSYWHHMWVSVLANTHTHTHWAALYVKLNPCNTVKRSVNKSGEEALKQPRCLTRGMSWMPNSLIVSWRRAKHTRTHTVRKSSLLWLWSGFSHEVIDTIRSDTTQNHQWMWMDVSLLQMVQNEMKNNHTMVKMKNLISCLTTKVF